jgi:probable HAF family extracellular repeat protein
VSFYCNPFQLGSSHDVYSTRTSPDSPFAALLTAFGINDEGKIVGFGATTSGDLHAFLAVPCDGEGAENEDTAADAREERVPVTWSQSVRTLISGRPGMANTKSF